MSGGAGLVQLTAVAWLGFAGVASGATAWLYGRLRPRVLAAAPAARSRRLTGWLAAPVVAATALTLLCFAPSLVSLALGVHDHCGHHDDAHAHFCFVHRTPDTGSAAGWVVAAALGALLMVPAATQVAALLRARHAARALRSVARLRGGSERAGLVECARPFAATVGFLRPHVVVSSGLLRGLDPAERRAVLAHERAHARRLDNLRRLVTGFLGVVLPPGTRRLLLADLALACEEACDHEASAAVGDPLVVASAIVRAERLAGAPSVAPWASAFGESDVTARVEALLAPVTPAPRNAPSRRLWLVLLPAAAVLAGPLHHAVETAAGLLH